MDYNYVLIGDLGKNRNYYMYLESYAAGDMLHAIQNIVHPNCNDFTDSCYLVTHPLLF